MASRLVPPLRPGLAYNASAGGQGPPTCVQEERRFAIESEAIRNAAEEEARKLLANLQASGPRMPKPRARASDAATAPTAPDDASAGAVSAAGLPACEKEESEAERKHGHI